MSLRLNSWGVFVLDIRVKIKEEFEKFKNVNDPAEINHLIKGLLSLHCESR